MTYENYINQSMSMCERKINMKTAKNPKLLILLGRNKNQRPIRNYSQITFNNF